MKVNQLNHVALHVANLDVSARFYRDVLNLTPIRRPAFGFPGAWFGIGADQELHLIARDQPEDGAPYTVPRERHWALNVENIDAAVHHLRALSIEFTGPKPRPDGVPQVFLRDPDGHVIELCQVTP